MWSRQTAPGIVRGTRETTLPSLYLNQWKRKTCIVCVWLRLACHIVLTDSCILQAGRRTPDYIYANEGKRVYIAELVTWFSWVRFFSFFAINVSLWYIHRRENRSNLSGFQSLWSKKSWVTWWYVGTLHVTSPYHWLWAWVCWRNDDVVNISTSISTLSEAGSHLEAIFQLMNKR